MRVTIVFKNDAFTAASETAKLYFDRVCTWVYEDFDVGSPSEAIDQCIGVGAAIDEDSVAEVELDANEYSLYWRLKQHMGNTHEFEVLNGQKYYSREGLQRVLDEYRANTETRTE